MEALNSRITIFDNNNIQPFEREAAANMVLENPKYVCNFAAKTNENRDEITQELIKGNMLVDWLKEWKDRLS